jgi:predicted RNA binding protein YcfA (HicA-like mRNA interferase family)
MPKLKRLSGGEVIDIFKQFGFEVHSQKGSHIKLRRIGISGKETLTVPNHRQLDTGTCRAIYRQACKYVIESDLFPYFYE